MTVLREPEEAAVIDLRSDTVTVPTAAMRRAMADAEVGDDVYHDDPTVNRLEERVADILGKEAAMYVPTGTMANQIALRVHTRPGDVVLAAEGAHVDSHELGAANALAGVTIRLLDSPDGTFTARQVLDAVPVPPEELPPWLFQPVRLVEVENTHNEAGGTVWPPERLAEVTGVAADLEIATHLDGARLWNAAAALGVPEADLADGFDTVSVCFSKGLGAPVGSALAGSAALVAEARRFKQMYGGGFRQAGILAAAALHAIDHHRERLVEDHLHAWRFAAALCETPGVEVDLDRVQTNMVYFAVDDAPRFVARCRDAGVAMLALGPSRIRAVFHLGIDDAATDRAIAAVTAAAAG